MAGRRFNLHLQPRTERALKRIADRRQISQSAACHLAIDTIDKLDQLLGADDVENDNDTDSLAIVDNEGHITKVTSSQESSSSHKFHRLNFSRFFIL